MNLNNLKMALGVFLASLIIILFVADAALAAGPSVDFCQQFAALHWYVADAMLDGVSSEAIGTSIRDNLGWPDDVIYELLIRIGVWLEQGATPDAIQHSQTLRRAPNG
mgnify:CR=1 FL=1